MQDLEHRAHVLYDDGDYTGAPCVSYKSGAGAEEVSYYVLFTPFLHQPFL
jgi:hypothetical protein